MTVAGGHQSRAEGPGPHASPGRLFWPAVVCGWMVMAIGAWGLLSDPDKTKPGESVRFVLGAAVVHDLILAPVVVLAGWGVAKVVPARVRGPVQAAVIVSAMVALFSVPFVRGYGRVATNPSILPRNYSAGLAVILVGVWVTAAGVVFVRSRRRTQAATVSEAETQPAPPG